MQVIEAEDISLDSVVILSFEGLSLASVVICLDFEMISEHFVAVALLILPDDEFCSAFAACHDCVILELSADTEISSTLTELSCNSLRLI